MEDQYNALKQDFNELNEKYIILQIKLAELELESKRRKSVRNNA